MSIQQALNDAAELFDTQATAAVLGMSPGTLVNWRASGEGPPFVRLGARRVRYRRADLERWLRERTHNPEARQ